MNEKKQIDSKGYPLIYEPTHPKANNRGYVHEHVLIAEKALGKFLPKGCEVHHIDKNKIDVSSGNLVICQDRAYHMLLHQRQRAFDACGNANFRKCVHCKLYSDHETMRDCGNAFAHWECYRQYANAYFKRKTEEWRKEKDGAC